MIVYNNIKREYKYIMAMLNKKKIPRTEYYKANVNVLYVKDFLAQRRLQKEKETRRKRISIVMLVIITVINLFFVLSIIK